MGYIETLSEKEIISMGMLTGMLRSVVLVSHPSILAGGLLQVETSLGCRIRPCLRTKENLCSVVVVAVAW